MFKKDPNSTIKKIYEPTDKAKKFLEKVENPRYDRGMIRGLTKFIGNKVPEDMQGFYSEQELEELELLIIVIVQLNGNMNCHLICLA